MTATGYRTWSNEINKALLQAPALKEPGSAHHFAARHAIEIGGDAFNFIDTRQLLRERALAIACHATFLVVE